MSNLTKAVLAIIAAVVMSFWSGWNFSTAYSAYQEEVVPTTNQSPFTPARVTNI